MIRNSMLLAAALLIGCGDSNLVPVAGVVQLDGKPVAKAAVLFHHTSGQTAYAITDDGGRFQLTTRHPSDGALRGEHAITVTLTVQEGGVQADANGLEDYTKPTAPIRSRVVVPLVYNDPGATPLRVTIDKAVSHMHVDLSTLVGARTAGERR